MRRVLLLFLDGVGLGDEADWNPFVHAELPVLRGLLEGRTVTRGAAGSYRRASLLALDATLGVAGIPQSGTGQATLLTGRDAVAMHGNHFGPWVPVKLRPMLAHESILARAVRAGRRVAFANAYPRPLIDASAAGVTQRRATRFLRAGPPVAAIGAGVFTRDADDLRRGNAVASEIVNDGWRDHLGYTDLPDIDARAAGTTLARIANENDLTMFAHYATDAAGHSQDLVAAVNALQRVDAFIGGVIDKLDDDVCIVVASDHGNIEDIRTGHTRNPAMGMLIGRDHQDMARDVTSLLHITPAIAAMLDAP